MNDSATHLNFARTLLCALAAAALGYALEQRDGAFDWAALGAVALALACLALAALGPRALDGLRATLLGESGAKVLLAALVLLQLALQFARPPGIDLHRIAFGPWPFWGGIALATALAVLGMLRRDPLGRARWPLLLAVHFGLCLWMLRASPSPRIDVFLFHRAGFAAILEGHSPYATSIPLLYGDARFYGEGLVRDGIVYVGHPYPPLSFALTFLAFFAFGDYRIALAAALTLSGACIAALARADGSSRAGATSKDETAARNPIGELCALLFLFSPRAFFVLEQGWTEPLVVLAVCALVLSLKRAPRATPWLLGALVAVKQYGFFALPLLPLLFPNESKAQRWRRGLLACAFALAVSLPLAVTAPRPFIDSVLLFQLRQPFRADALSLAAALFRLGGPMLLGWGSFAMLVPALALAHVLAPRGAAGFLAALAFAFAAFFDVGKQAFANYHFLVLSLAAAAASAMAARAADPLLTRSAAAD